MRNAPAAAIGFILGFVACSAINGLLEAGKASKNKRAFAEARNISDALERYREANGRYPPLDTGIAGLTKHLVPQFTRGIQIQDAYGRGYIVCSDTSGVAAVISTGQNGYLVRRRGTTIFPADGSFSRSSN
jgi:hypothetical protein